jgi:ribosome-associated protein
MEDTIESTNMALLAVELAEDKQASDIVMLDLREMNTIADYFVVCSGESDRQLRAIVNSVQEGIEDRFEQRPMIDGTPDSGWVVLDYGDVVVHIFSATLRDYYRIERLWGKATPVVVVQ